MNTSISPKPKNVRWPAGQAPFTKGTPHESCRNWAPHGSMNTVSMSKTMNSIATM